MTFYDRGSWLRHSDLERWLIYAVYYDTTMMRDECYDRWGAAVALLGQPLYVGTMVDESSHRRKCSTSTIALFVFTTIVFLVTDLYRPWDRSSG